MGRVADFLLPVSSVMGIILYLHPNMLPAARLGEDPMANALTLLAWGFIGGLGGVLVTATVSLAFYLLYSPFYLVTQVGRLIGPPRWVDKSEQRFYTRCFLLLCVVGGAAWADLSAGLIMLLSVSGSTPLLWKFLL